MAFTNDVLLRMLQIIKGTGGVSDKSLLMLGMQQMNLHEAFLDVLLESGLIEDKHKFSEKALENSIQFFKLYGFKEVHALDVSDYEKADIIFNLNDELPENLSERFDIVFDGGVIEHVFNIGKAFTNICRMTKVGGYIFSHNPTYNCLHNTFWNISPEMFLDFYSANNYQILDCSMITFLTENSEKRAWTDRPVIWSPDVRLMNFLHPLYPGEHLRSMHKLCGNPLPHTFIVAKKTHSKELIYPIVSGYAKKYKGEKEDTSRRTGKKREKYDIGKVVDFIRDKEKVCLYCAGDVCEAILKELYKNNLEGRIDKIFDSDLKKIGGRIMDKKISYMNNNTLAENDEIIVCSEKYAEEVYTQICQKGVKANKVYRLTDSNFLKQD